MDNDSESSSVLQEKLSLNVREFRLRLGFSQEELADKCGYHRTYIGSIERNERNITIQTLERLAKALDVEVTELLRPHD